ncbi:MAG TPA: tRNA (guanosine(37)-N1)-methyltransferase TrmD [Candidatus Dadabacteria bacterium]|nr:tRNA (guanosine(37)-N1)-methyltransferase TrmD [Candidatus Dadabacteria bacterium]
MIFNVLTVFREIFRSPLKYGILSKAIKKNKIKINLYNYNDFLKNNERIDDSQYGGDAGMVITYDKASRAIEAIKSNNSKTLVVFLTPKGRLLDNKLTTELAKTKNLTIVCGRYEGFDQRLIENYADLELSVGDYVISGGEIAALTIIDSVSRMVNSVVGKKESVEKDSFQNSLLKNSVYTRPAVFKRSEVPRVLVSGDHKRIAKFNRNSSLTETLKKREDLLEKAHISPEERDMLKEIKVQQMKSSLYLALVHYPIEDINGDIIKTSLTNLDIQDIARSCKTYGIKKYFITHPVKEQRDLAESVLGYWRDNRNNRNKSSKHEAMELVKITQDISEAINSIKSIHNKRPKVVATDARIMHNMVNYSRLKDIIESDSGPYLFLFGTGWGLAKEILDGADYIIKPVGGYLEYNHLSVRSAVAIILDRLFGCNF